VALDLVGPVSMVVSLVHPLSSPQIAFSSHRSAARRLRRRGGRGRIVASNEVRTKEADPSSSLRSHPTTWWGAQLLSQPLAIPLFRCYTNVVVDVLARSASRACCRSSWSRWSTPSLTSSTSSSYGSFLPPPPLSLPDPLGFCKIHPDHRPWWWLGFLSIQRSLWVLERVCLLVYCLGLVVSSEQESRGQLNRSYRQTKIDRPSCRLSVVIRSYEPATAGDAFILYDDLVWISWSRFLSAVHTHPDPDHLIRFASQWSPRPVNGWMSSMHFELWIPVRSASSFLRAQVSDCWH
jgi:hypothetical protein